MAHRGEGGARTIGAGGEPPGERDTQRHTERERHRQRERHTQRERERARERERERKEGEVRNISIPRVLQSVLSSVAPPIPPHLITTQPLHNTSVTQHGCHTVQPLHSTAASYRMS